MEEAAVIQVDDNPITQFALAELNKVDAGIARLSEQFKGVVFDVRTTKGMDEAKKARLTIREPRYAVEKIRKEQASRIRAAQLALNSEAERITLALREIEDPIDLQIKTEEERKEREKQEAIQRELERVAGIRARIDAIVEAPARVALAKLTSAQIYAEAQQLANTPIDPEFFQEFTDEANHVATVAVAKIMVLRDQAVDREEEARQAAAQAELFAKQQRELEALRAELAAKEAAIAAAAAAAAKAQAEADAERRKAERAMVAAAKQDEIPDLPPAPKPVKEVSTPAPKAEAPKAEPAPAKHVEVVDDTPSVFEIVAAVAERFGVSIDTAKRYVVTAAEELSFEVI